MALATRSMAPGAVQLPMAHLSARVPWHDTDWTGKVCRAPAANHSCSVLKNINTRKDSDAEELDLGKAWTKLSRARVPPCVFERGGFMRSAAYSIERDHPYAKKPSHTHFKTTTHRMAPYSVEATPYLWMMREQAVRLADLWGISYDVELERKADQLISLKSPTWVQDHRNQLALLDSFFSAIETDRSLVFFYVKDLPLVEDRIPGTRYLIGVGKVSDVADHVEWDYSGAGPIRSVLWERSVSHSIRQNFKEGFILPYQELLVNPELQGTDLRPFLAIAPQDHFDEFSYASEHVGNDAAIAALLELTRVVQKLNGVADGPWDQVSTWLSGQIANTWKLRGAYPGLGSALTAAGFERGALVAHRVIESLDSPGADPWPALHAAISDSAARKGPAADLVGRTARKVWSMLQANPERLKLLKVLARFSLSVDQARRVFDPDQRKANTIAVTDGEILANPYRIFELERGRVDPVVIETIDRGLFPHDAAARRTLEADDLNDPVQEASDDRRVRAACLRVLEEAAEDGHTLLDESSLRRRVSLLPLDPLCDPSAEVFNIAAAEFAPLIVATSLAGDGGRAWQLDRLALAKKTIADDVSKRIKAGALDVTWKWREAIDRAIAQAPKKGDSEEESARVEKAAALKVLARSRIAALVGPAGTGKTTMLEALCAHSDVKNRGVLLLAPTGKARVQLSDKVGATALTMAQYLRRSDRWHQDYGYRVVPSGKRDASYRTVVVDEASMLTEEMLAALIDATTGVDRLVLCGDHRQLPPIGAGRPFADLVNYLRSDSGKTGSGGGIAELTIGRRISRVGGKAANKAGDDLTVASWFSVEGSSPAADEVFARVLAGNGDDTIRIIQWHREEDLHEKVAGFLATELNIQSGDADELKRSLGARGVHNGRATFNYGEGGLGAENWQILTPVRSRPGGVTGLNRLVRRRWREGDATRARSTFQLPPPMGADEILFHDKVMCASNHKRKGWDVARHEQEPDGQVANGEIGIAVHWYKRSGLKIEFSTQPGLQFTFWEGELNGDGERSSGDLLSLAYAVTIHKAQGSQFGTTLVVIPNPCNLLSPELVYTALTRHRQRTALFIQGDPTNLRALASPSRSETARRLTCLFRPSDPMVDKDDHLFDAAHVHRTVNGELVRSKSEVIVANVLGSLGLEYEYEQPLSMADGSTRIPDFRIDRGVQPPVYWEHLGMLDVRGYRADWEAKRKWYASHGIRAWEDGGGPEGILVWSSEGDLRGGIDAQSIEKLARAVFKL